MMRVFTGVGRSGARDEPVGGHARAGGTGVAPRRPALSSPTTPTATARGAERVDVVGGVGGAAEPHLALGEAQDEDRRLARDARGLAVEVLVGDEVADDHDAPAGKAG